MRPSTIIGLVVIAGGIIVLIIGHESGMIGGFTNDQFAGIVSLVAILILVGGAAFSGRLRTDLRNAVVWIGIAVLLVAGYAYRDELRPVFSRITGELIPSAPRVVGSEVQLRRGAGGHFNADALINGRSIEMLIDTGASRVSLSQGDAASIGIDPAALRYVIPVQTANGEVMMAGTRLASVTIGSIRADDVSAFVAPPGALSGSVIGMSFLERLSGYSVNGNTLTLTP